MDKKSEKINISIDNEIKKKLDDGDYNKSKLINRLLEEWLKTEKDNINLFVKKI